jgi:hypothetical protein
MYNKGGPKPTAPKSTKPMTMPSMPKSKPKPKGK